MDRFAAAEVLDRPSCLLTSFNKVETAVIEANATLTFQNTTHIIVACTIVQAEQDRLSS